MNFFLFFCTIFLNELEYFRNIIEKIVSSFQWDAEDPKLLVCHAKSTPFPAKKQDTNAKESSAILLWVSNERGLLVHEVSLTRYRNIMP